MQKIRSSGVDIIKVIATIFVISIHTIGMTHVLGMNMEGPRAFLIVLFRYTVMSCVPLFLIITGFLQNKKTVSTKFYKGLIPILTSYIFISIITSYVNLNYAHTQDDLLTSILGIFNFTTNNYSWYVEMFIGLFLLIPFFNILYNNISSKLHKQLFIGIMMFLTIVPSLCSFFKTDKYNFDVVSNYWIELFPFTYYFIGAYISEFKPKIKKIFCILIILIMALIPTSCVFVLAKGGEYVDWILNGFFSASAMIIALFIFLLLYDIDIKNRPCKMLFSTIAVSSLDIYLFSNVVEKLLYPHFPTGKAKLIVMIFLVFALSFIAAKIKSVLFYLVKRIFYRHHKIIVPESPASIEFINK